MSSMDDKTPEAVHNPPAVPIQPVLVIGFDSDGNLRYVSNVSPAETVFFLEKVKIVVLQQNTAKVESKLIVTPPPGARIS